MATAHGTHSHRAAHGPGATDPTGVALVAWLFRGPGPSCEDAPMGAPGTVEGTAEGT